MPPKLKFVDGERVLCFHGPLVYDAKLMRSQVSDDKEVKYYVHYNGWNKNWDEWVPESRVLKHSEANVDRLKEIYQEPKKKNTGTAPGPGSKAKKAETDLKSSSSRASSPQSSKDVKEQSPSSPDSSASPTASSVSSTTAGVPTSSSASTTTSTSSGSTATAPTAVVSSTSTTPVPNASSATARAARSSTKVAGSTPSASDEIAKKKRRLETRSNSSSQQQPPSTSAPVAATQTTATTTTAAATPVDGPKHSGALSPPPLEAAAVSLAASVESEEHFRARIEVQIKMPDDLKPWLVNDWDAINQRRMVLDLPAKTTVQDIVRAYIAYKKALKPAREMGMNDIANSLITYFDVMLGSQLLYKFERPQYSKLVMRHPNAKMSTLYGGIHLLRLFTRLGTMLAFTALDDRAVQLLLVHLADFMKYMLKHATALFGVTPYINVTPEYLRMAPTY